MSSETTFAAVADFYLTPLLGAAGFKRPELPAADNWGSLRVTDLKNDWFIAPVFNVDERTSDVEFGNQDFLKKPLTLHLYLRLVNPAKYYEVGAVITHSDAEISDLVCLYADALKHSARGILYACDDACDQLYQATTTQKGLCPPYHFQPPGEVIVSRFM
jgi:hypothetical protein